MVGFGKFVPLGQSVNSFFLRKRLQNCIQIHGLTSKQDYLSIDLPQKPKRPSTTFVLFLKKVREELQEEKPQIKSTEVLKIAGERWKNIDPAYKSTLQEEYNKKALIYKQAMQQYLNSLTPQQQKLLNSKKDSSNSGKDKDPNALKRPLTSFFVYLKEQVPKEKAMNSEITRKDIISKLAKTWRELPEAEKQRYAVMSQKYKEEYKTALIKRDEKIKEHTE